MGLDDRNYMGGSSQQGSMPSYLQKSLTLFIVVATAVIFLASSYLYPVFQFGNIAIWSGELWRLTTGLLVLDSQNIVGAIFTLLIFYIFSREAERFINWRQLAQLYATSALGASLLGSLILQAFGAEFSGGIFTCLLCSAVMAFSMLHASQELNLMLFFVLPVKLKGRTIAFLMLCGLLLTGLFGDRTSLFALLATAITYIYLHRLYPALSFELGFGETLNRLKKKRRRRRRRKMNLLQKNFHLVKGDEVSVDDFISTKIDPILEKIADEGLSALSPDERDLLAKAREDLKKK